MKSSKLLSNAEAADIIGCAHQTLRAARITGKLFGIPAPAYLKIGANVRYRPETIEAWLDQLQERRTVSDLGGDAA